MKCGSVTEGHACSYCTNGESECGAATAGLGLQWRPCLHQQQDSSQRVVAGCVVKGSGLVLKIYSFSIRWKLADRSKNHSSVSWEEKVSDSHKR